MSRQHPDFQVIPFVAFVTACCEAALKNGTAIDCASDGRPTSEMADRLSPAVCPDGVCPSDERFPFLTSDLTERGFERLPAARSERSRYFRCLHQHFERVLAHERLCRLSANEAGSALTGFSQADLAA